MLVENIGAQNGVLIELKIDAQITDAAAINVTFATAKFLDICRFMFQALIAKHAQLLDKLKLHFPVELIKLLQALLAKRNLVHTDSTTS